MPIDTRAAEELLLRRPVPNSSYGLSLCLSRVTDVDYDQVRIAIRDCIAVNRALERNIKFAILLIICKNRKIDPHAIVPDSPHARTFQRNLLILADIFGEILATDRGLVAEYNHEGVPLVAEATERDQTFLLKKLREFGADMQMPNFSLDSFGLQKHGEMPIHICLRSYWQTSLSSGREVVSFETLLTILQSYTPSQLHALLPSWLEFMDQRTHHPGIATAKMLLQNAAAKLKPYHGLLTFMGPASMVRAAGTPQARFVNADGDYHVMTRVAEFLLESPAPR